MGDCKSNCVGPALYLHKSQRWCQCNATCQNIDFFLKKFTELGGTLGTILILNTENQASWQQLIQPHKHENQNFEKQWRAKMQPVQWALIQQKDKQWKDSSTGDRWVSYKHWKNKLPATHQHLPEWPKWIIFGPQHASVMPHAWTGLGKHPECLQLPVTHQHVQGWPNWIMFGLQHTPSAGQSCLLSGLGSKSTQRASRCFHTPTCDRIA
jgi:hypothetical protein